MLFILPETSHNRGIDEARKALGPNASNKFIWVWINPLKPLDLLKRKSVLMIVRFIYYISLEKGALNTFFSPESNILFCFTG